MTTTLIPAIDLLDGRCVRLLHGDFDNCKFYDVDVARLASDYAAQGAAWLHVVDLAASRDGPKADTRPLFRLLGNAPQQVQTGGGVRVAADIRSRLDHGANRVVVGSVCVTQPEVFCEWLETFGADHVVAALDVRLDEDGTPRPRTHGWTRGGDQSLWELLDYYSGRGLRHLLCTDIGRDGALSGPNLDLYRQLSGRYPDLQVQASGGISGLRDLKRLAGTGVSAAITGKALLEGCFTVAEALEELA